MALLVSLAFSLFLLGCAAALIVWHVRAWRGCQHRRLEASEMDFYRRQFRRRMQTSAMLALLAAALPAGHWIVLKGTERPQSDWPKWGIVFWGVVVLILIWVGVLALVDLWASRYFFGRLRQRNWLERTRLEGQLRRMQAGGNGKPPGTPRRKGPELKDQGPEP